MTPLSAISMDGYAATTSARSPVAALHADGGWFSILVTSTSLSS
jgi:hypothetical protein